MFDATRDRRSFADVLNANRGVGPGFDLVRLGLACAIFYGHTLWIAGAAGVNLAPRPPAMNAVQDVTNAMAGGWEGPKRALHLMLVPMFFAVSGFLVTGSAWRVRSVRQFLVFRGLRIFPALSVEVALSALLLGPFLTTVSLQAYFSDWEFWRYFGNIIGVVTFILPGLFENNPVPRTVNVNLWTLTAEFYCYLLIAVAIGTSLIYNRKWFTRIFVAASLGLLIANSVYSFGETSGPYPSHVAVYYFFMGCAFYLWKDEIPFSVPLFVVAVGVMYALMSFHHTIYLAPAFATYAILFIGLTRPLRAPGIDLIPERIRSVDYSYGVYLYGFPIAQALVIVWPSFRGHGWYLLAATTVLTFSFAYASWVTVEKPTLKLKKRLAPKRVASAGAVEQAASG